MLTDARWTQHPELASPAAVETARELEQRFYTQHRPADLDDREGVIVVDGQTGAAAPARYHRHGAPVADGNRPEHVFEAFPDSPWAHSLPYAQTLTTAADKPTSRLGIFRLNHPRHMDDVAALYNGRAHRDRDQSRPFERPEHWGPDPLEKTPTA